MAVPKSMDEQIHEIQKSAMDKMANVIINRGNDLPTYDEKYIIDQKIRPSQAECT